MGPPSSGTSQSTPLHSGQVNTDGRPVAVFPGPANHANVAAMHQQMVVGRRYIDTPRANGLAIGSVDCRQRSIALQDGGQAAGTLTGDVQHHEDSAREIGGQLPYQ